MALKLHDFVEINYTGKINETIFDTTDSKLGENLDKNKKYAPVTVCIGEEQVIKGVDKSLIGKKPGDSYFIAISPLLFLSNLSSICFL